MHNYTGIKLWGLLLAVAVLTGCAGMGSPKNAEEFRQVVRNGPFKTTDSFEVARPLADVSATLRKKSAECLNIAIKWSNTKGRSGVITYKPTFVAGATRAELHVQRKPEGGGEIVIGAPPDGEYRVVLDATALSKSRSKIDVYLWSAIDDKFLASALEGWAKGDNLGCPDLTRR